MEAILNNMQLNQSQLPLKPARLAGDVFRARQIVGRRAPVAALRAGNRGSPESSRSRSSRHCSPRQPTSGRDAKPQLKKVSSKISDENLPTGESKLQTSGINKVSKSLKFKYPAQETHPLEESKSQANRLGFVIGLQNELAKNQPQKPFSAATKFKVQKINLQKIVNPKKKTPVNLSELLKPRETHSALGPNNNTQNKKLRVIKVKKNTANMNNSEIISPNDIS